MPDVHWFLFFPQISQVSRWCEFDGGNLPPAASDSRPNQTQTRCRYVDLAGVRARTRDHCEAHFAHFADRTYFFFALTRRNEKKMLIIVMIAFCMRLSLLMICVQWRKSWLIHFEWIISFHFAQKRSNWCSSVAKAATAAMDEWIKKRSENKCLLDAIGHVFIADETFFFSAHIIIIDGGGNDSRHTQQALNWVHVSRCAISCCWCSYKPNRTIIWKIACDVGCSHSLTPSPLPWLGYSCALAVIIKHWPACWFRFVWRVLLF